MTNTVDSAIWALARELGHVAQALQRRNELEECKVVALGVQNRVALLATMIGPGTIMNQDTRKGLAQKAIELEGVLINGE